MNYQGQFWSAIIRALLSFRRDRQFATQDDSVALEHLTEVEAGQISIQQLEDILESLTPDEHLPALGQSLIGYFDFNRMGNFFVYLTSSKHIGDALKCLRAYSNMLFMTPVELTVSKQSENILLSWAASMPVRMQHFHCYAFLALFRHLAGRQFDFTSMTCQDSGAAQKLIAGISQASLKEGEKCKLIFSESWLTQPSFYHSAQVQRALETSLVSSAPQPFTQQIQAIFVSAGSPARIRAEWVAMQLGMNESTFRRQLKQENLSFSHLLKNFMHDKACQQLISGEKTDDVAGALGFSDRRSFDRSFKEHTGISAGQVRQLGNRLRFQRGNAQLLTIVEHLPPLPDTIQSLLALDDNNLTVKQVVGIVKRDPIFHAHLMGKASKAIYGSSPATLEQAIGRNLGLANIKHLGVVFAAQQMLTAQSRFENVPALIDAMILSESLFASLFGYSGMDASQADTQRQIMLFGQLSLLLIFHDDCLFAEGALRQLENADTYGEFLHAVNREFGLCLYGATSLMLLRWGFTDNINQQLWKLCQAGNDIGSTQVQLATKLCHELAFTLLCFDADNAEALTDSYPLNEKQKSDYAQIAKQLPMLSSISSN